jgi:hypothetical protein
VIRRGLAGCCGAFRKRLPSLPLYSNQIQQFRLSLALEAARLCALALHFQYVMAHEGSKAAAVAVLLHVLN